MSALVVACQRHCTRCFGPNPRLRPNIGPWPSTAKSDMPGSQELQAHADSQAVVGKKVERHEDKAAARSAWSALPAFHRCHVSSQKLCHDAADLGANSTVDHTEIQAACTRRSLDGSFVQEFQAHADRQAVFRHNVVGHVEKAAACSAWRTLPALHRCHVSSQKLCHDAADLGANSTVDHTDVQAACTRRSLDGNFVQEFQAHTDRQAVFRHNVVGHVEKAAACSAWRTLPALHLYHVSSQKLCRAVLIWEQTVAL